MKWDFSCVDCSGDNVKQALYDHINNRIERFASDYEYMLPSKIKIFPNQGISSFESLLSVIHKTNFKLYLFIDEYGQSYF
ncbi:hypothetical protein MHK_007647 [Candidatus Magnetomorum sp. HK-1]|nr:hypothetical protein MHK_007647 [Candidatus Magnetomorum sp. HK-1]